jgi:hypothetical protein
MASTSVSPQPKPSIDNMITHILSTKFHTFAIVYGVARHLYHVSAIAFFTLLSTTLRPRPALALPRLSHGQSMAEPRAPALLSPVLPSRLRGLGTVRCTLGGSLAKCLIPDTANKLRMPWTTSALPVAAPRRTRGEGLAGQGFAQGHTWVGYTPV